MIAVNVEHLGDMQFEVKARGHRVLSDQPSENGGFDEGMTPPELLLASLGSCAGYYAADYLRTNNILSRGTRLSVSAEKVPGPARMDRFQIEVEVPSELTDAQRTGIERAIQRCLIKNTFLHPPAIAVDVHSAVTA